MYDNISLKTAATFANTQVFDDFCSRFVLVGRDDKGVKFDNYSTSGLSQNMGLRLAYDTGTGVLKVDFSLHKYWNSGRGLGQINYNVFTVTDMQTCCIGLVQLFAQYGISLSDAAVLGYEFGLNLPISYFSTVALLLEQMHDGYTFDGKTKRVILKDRRQVGLVGTQITKNTRVVFVMYDKGKEVREKTANGANLGEMLRVEVKHRRVTKTAFKDLFLNRHIVATTLERELTMAFCDGLFFRNFALPYFERVIRDIDLYGTPAAALVHYESLEAKKLINGVQLAQYKAAIDKYKGYELPTMTNDEKIFRGVVLANLMLYLV